MTGVDTDLATLRHPSSARARRAAVARVEAELSRLREERDAYRNAESWMTTCLNCSRLLDSCYSETIRAEAAEARCARLEAERNEYAERLQWLRDLREREGSWGKPYERAMASSDPRGGEPYECEEERDQLAERCARLQQALEPARVFMEHFVPVEEALINGFDVDAWCALADEALAGPDTPADSQEDIDVETWGLMQGGGQPEVPS